MSQFDLIVIGAGPGGYVAAIRAAQLGMKVALVDKRGRLGGTCLNVGCIPSKALLESSELYHTAVHVLDRHGVAATNLSYDLAAMMSRKERIVQELTDGISGLMKKNKISTIQATAELKGPDRVRVRTDSSQDDLTAGHIVLATGSEPVELPFLPFDHRQVIDSTDALSLSEVPERLVVVGAGAVGLELGSVYHRLGANVTVVEMLAQIAPFADKQVARSLERSLEEQGMTFRLKTKVTRAKIAGGSVTLVLEDAKGTTGKLESDRVLVAVGRRPHTTGLALETVGIEVDRQGRIPVDDRFYTGVGSIYAIGDVIAGPMLAHKAEEEGVAVAEILAGETGHVNYEVIPSVVYTTPELAVVGLNEEGARSQGLKVRVGRSLFRANGRAKAMGQEEGMIKILADEETGRLLGVHIVGPRVSEMVAEAVVAIQLKSSAEDLARTVHAHPTLSEALREAALDVNKRAIHA